MIQRYSNKVVNTFLIGLSTISLIGVFTQLGAIQSTLSIRKNFIYTLIVLICVFLYLFRKHIEKILGKVFIIDYLYPAIFIFIFIVLIIYQLNMIQALTGSMDLDPAFIYNLILNRPTADKAYFSWCSNLLLLLNIENGIYYVLGKPSIYVYLCFLNYINMLLIDSGILLIYLTAKKQLGKRIGFFTFLISILLYGITPYIAIPYSDNWAFFICSLFIFLLSTMYSNHKWNINNPFIIVLFGIVSSLLYKIKPSTSIALISTIIIIFLILATKHEIKRERILSKVKIIILFLIPFILTFEVCNYFADNNGLVKIERNQSASPLHFIAMGLHGDGQYWEEFNNKDKNLPLSARKQYEIKTIKKDINDFNSLGSFLNFIIHKQQDNSGLASWQRNTGPVSWNLSPKLKLHNGFQKFLRNTFTKNNFFYWNGCLIFVQLIWAITIGLMISAYSEINYFVQIIKFTVVGGFLFLLIFEGGVSRYMIQYLPFVIILASYGLKAFLNRR